MKRNNPQRIGTSTHKVGLNRKHEFEKWGFETVPELHEEVLLLRQTLPQRNDVALRAHQPTSSTRKREAMTNERHALTRTQGHKRTQARRTGTLPKHTKENHSPLRGRATMRKAT